MCICVMILSSYEQMNLVFKLILKLHICHQSHCLILIEQALLGMKTKWFKNWIVFASSAHLRFYIYKMAVPYGNYQQKYCLKPIYSLFMSRKITSTSKSKLSKLYYFHNHTVMIKVDLKLCTVNGKLKRLK